MFQIDKQNCTAIGYIHKTHRLKGEVIAFIEDEYIETVESSEYIFIDIDGGLVPFFIGEEGLRFRNNESVIIRFDFINSLDRAKDLTGHKIYIVKDVLPDRENFKQYSELIGMKVIDLHRGELGIIDRMDDFAGNVVIGVKNPHGEILVPIHERILSRIDKQNGVIYLDCPEGLIDIYLG